MKKNESILKPKISDTIYVECLDGITECTVYMKGKTEFCHSYAFNDNFIENFRRPLRYKDCGETWFTSLDQVLEKYNNKITLVQTAHNYWEIRDKEEQTK